MTAITYSSADTHMHLLHTQPLSCLVCHRENAHHNRGMLTLACVHIMAREHIWRFFTSALLQEISPSVCNLCQTRQLSDALLCERCVAAEVKQRTDRVLTQSLQVCESVFTDVNHS